MSILALRLQLASYLLGDPITLGALPRHNEHLLPGGTLGDGGPPCVDVRAGGDEVALACGVHQHVGVGQVEEVRQAEELACQVLALGKVSLVHVEDLLKLGRLLSHQGVVALHAQHGHDHPLITYR